MFITSSWIFCYYTVDICTNYDRYLMQILIYYQPEQKNIVKTAHSERRATPVKRKTIQHTSCTFMRTSFILFILLGHPIAMCNSIGNQKCEYPNLAYFLDAVQYKSSSEASEGKEQSKALSRTDNLPHIQASVHSSETTST